jgi:hypothetical protein
MFSRPPKRTPAQALLLDLLHADGLHSTPFSPNAEPVWREALQLADAHGLAPLLHEQSQQGALKELPELARRELRAARIAELAREEKRSRAQRNALRILAGDDAKPPMTTLLLKGAASARTIYPAPELRPRSDLDLLVSPLDRREALTRLFSRGYAQHEKTRGTREDEPGWHEKTLVDPETGEQIDLHFALSQASRHRLDAPRLFAASVREPALGAGARLLPPEEAALVCVHSLVIHELSSPLIALCDLARLLAKAEPLALVRQAIDVRLGRGLVLGVQLLLSLKPQRAGPFSVGGAVVEPASLALLAAKVPLRPGVRALLLAAARRYDLERRPAARLGQLWRKALFIDRSRDVARFAFGHALQSLRRRAAG